ncbi:hypothetical protein BZG02_18800 [Labilibaculum filiforme]|uniref:Uncharacterized protein n=1 Tax=Labilibaculum filiforme TaxID=1940526 RepID=A0A2N3HR35_9BACT|nr:hypothetical protein [Labilibaculum filiforme]PKQ60515.1 hypothetical protein BZG02_18800 [Labilibaculum filiforme]
MIKSVKQISLVFLAVLTLSCSKEDEVELNAIDAPNSKVALKSVSYNDYDSENYFEKPSDLPVKNFTGTTSTELQMLIDNNKEHGAIIKIPKNIYAWGEVQLRSKIQLEIEKNTIIKPLNNSVKRLFSIGIYGTGERVTDVSIVGDGGKFTVDLSASANLNKQMAVVKVGRVSNFRIANFRIKERRTALASILVSYIKSDIDNEPFPKNGVIEEINQIGISHTGYGLVQGYSASKVLFKNLSCIGGVTLRLETDDRTMKGAVKDGGKAFGLNEVYAYGIRCTSGICPLMLSPHFSQNGMIHAKSITAVGCAFAVRVEQGFVEVFDTNKAYAPTTAGGIEFRNFIASKISGVGSSNKFVGAQYKRGNNNDQWAIRLSDASINGTLDSYIKTQIGTLKSGIFLNTTISEVKAFYRPTDAKLKQTYLAFFPCNEWTTKIKRPTDIGMGSGFEYYGPSMGLRFDNTDGTTSNGNYVIIVSGNAIGFGSNLRNVLYDTPEACTSNAYGSIPTTTSPGL